MFKIQACIFNKPNFENTVNASAQPSLTTPVLPPGGNCGINIQLDMFTKWLPHTCMSCLSLMMRKQDQTGETVHFNVSFLFSTS